jgi:hypothetical protein
MTAGYRIERDDSRAEVSIGREIKFRVLDGDVEAAYTSVRLRVRGRTWFVYPGPTTYAIDSEEARARAQALLVAADEADARNAAESNR